MGGSWRTNASTRWTCKVRFLGGFCYMSGRQSRKNDLKSIFFKSNQNQTPLETRRMKWTEVSRGDLRSGRSGDTVENKIVCCLVCSNTVKWTALPTNTYHQHYYSSVFVRFHAYSALFDHKSFSRNNTEFSEVHPIYKSLCFLSFPPIEWTVFDLLRHTMHQRLSAFIHNFTLLLQPRHTLKARPSCVVDGGS